MNISRTRTVLLRYYARNIHRYSHVHSQLSFHNHYYCNLNTHTGKTVPNIQVNTCYKYLQNCSLYNVLDNSDTLPGSLCNLRYNLQCKSHYCYKQNLYSQGSNGTDRWSLVFQWYILHIGCCWNILCSCLGIYGILILQHSNHRYILYMCYRSSDLGHTELLYTPRDLNLQINKTGSEKIAYKEQLLNDLQFYVLRNSISVIADRWKGVILTLKHQAKLQQTTVLCFYFYLLKKKRLDVSCESSARQRIHMKYEIKKKKKKKNNEKVFMNVVCCNRDWRFTG